MSSFHRSSTGMNEMTKISHNSSPGIEGDISTVTEKTGQDNPAFNGSTTSMEEDRIDPAVQIETSQPSDVHDNGTADGLLYKIDDVPPWYTCIALGFQVYTEQYGCHYGYTLSKHYLTMFGSTLSIPLVLAPHLCLVGDHLGLAEIISTIFFVSGLCTLLQTTIGSRLPIVQGGTFAFLTPTIALLSLPRWKCDYSEDRGNESDVGQLLNSTLPSVGSEEHREMWQLRIREIQGAIMVASLFQVAIGFSGLMGIILRFIGPLAVTPTVTLIGLALFGAATTRASKQWWIAIMTICLIALFSQYLRNVNLPCPARKKGGGIKKTGVPVFKLFPIILAMLLSWLICFILTETNVLASSEKEWGYHARTDTRTYVINEAAWFRFPYPGQWGMPTVSTAGVFGMLAGVLASMVESVGDYYACARLSGAPPPPNHAVNRGIGVEGIGCILAGAWGSGNGTTSYSQNIGAIGITKVGSRRVIQWGAFIMILLACLGKFGALFVTIPDPVIGGLLMVMFGMITAVGLSNLQFVDLNSSRNLFILGFSILLGLALPSWLNANKDAIQTGSTIANQIIRVLCSTSMFVGGFVGFVLDNTVPGTPEERGLTKWRALIKEDYSAEDSTSVYKCYDLPLIQKYIDRWHWASYLPFSPTFGRRQTPANRQYENNRQL